MLGCENHGVSVPERDCVGWVRIENPAVAYNKEDSDFVDRLKDIPLASDPSLKNPVKQGSGRCRIKTGAAIAGQQKPPDRVLL